MRFRTILLVWWALAAGASAAETGKEIEVRFAAQAAPPKLGKLVMTTVELRSEPFALPLNNLSEPQIAPGRSFRLEKEDKAGVLASVTLPATGEAFILLVVPGMKSGIEVVVIPDRAPSFRPGDYYVHNVAKKSILGQVGSTKFGLSSGTGKVVRPKGAREGRFYDVILAVREGTTSRVISTSRWPVGGQMRTYVFFFDDRKRKDVSFRAIDEFVPPDEKE
jgi:hypothetical protein